MPRPLSPLALLAVFVFLPGASLHAQAAGGGGDAYHDPVARRLVERARQARDELDRSLLSYTAVVQDRLGVALRTALKDRNLYAAESATRVRWSRDGGTVVQVLGARQEYPFQEEDELEWDVGMADEIFDPTSDRLYFWGPTERTEERAPDSTAASDSTAATDSAAATDSVAGAPPAPGAGPGVTDSAVVEDGESGLDFWIAHPLADDAEEHYRFRSGDTLVLSLPGGERLRAVELQVIPRRASIHHWTGQLWIEPESGALVRAVYRLARTLDLELAARRRDDTASVTLGAADEDEEDEFEEVPGIFRPLTVDISLLTVEYSLWDGRHWLPRRMRAEGQATAGILRTPVAVESSYRILDVETEGAGPDSAVTETAEEVMARWLGEEEYGEYALEPSERKREGSRIHILLPTDLSRLAGSEHLPPPIWEDAPAFATEEELRELYELLDRVPEAETVEGPGWRFHWGHQRPDLVRYNRVEGLSVGARVEGRTGSPAGPLDVALTGRIGTGDQEPNGTLTVTRESVRRRLTLSAHHGLVSVHEDARALGIGNSATALFFGRDDGEYFRSTGVALSTGPPESRRPWYGWRLYAEKQIAAPRTTDFALFTGHGAFRSNIDADRADQVGFRVAFRPWWGREAHALQGGAELMVQAETGTFHFGRTRLGLAAAFPVVEKVRGGVEASAGTTWGNVPVQRLWYLGGSGTLRGYGGSAGVGPDMLRARLELSRRFLGDGMGVVLFGDAGWAGEESAFDTDDVLYSAGVGWSLLDGLVRLDLARALRAPTGWRLELYVDAIL